MDCKYCLRPIEVTHSAPKDSNNETPQEHKYAVFIRHLMYDCVGSTSKDREPYVPYNPPVIWGS